MPENIWRQIAYYQGCRAPTLRFSSPILCQLSFPAPSWRPENERIDAVYFIDRGFASVVADGAGKRGIEVGLIGREGMTGLDDRDGQRSARRMTPIFRPQGRGSVSARPSFVRP